METKLKIVTALLVPYAFLCAGLYQIAFWAPFGINIFPYLDIADIVLSFIQPFLYSLFGGLLFFPVQMAVYGEILPYGGGNNGEQSKWKKLIWNLMQAFYIFGLVYLLVIHPDKWKGQYVPIYAFIGLNFVFTEFLLKKNIIKHSKLYFVITTILVVMPLMSFYIGTTAAKKIYTNKFYEYSTYVLPDKTLKFLGKCSEHYVFVSLDNKQKYFFATSEIKGLTLQVFEQTDEKTQANK